MLFAQVGAARAGFKLERRLEILAMMAVYVWFMVRIDVPMYLSQWRADEAARVSYEALGAGLRRMARCRDRSDDWAKWREDVTWMTLYERPRRTSRDVSRRRRGVDASLRGCPRRRRDPSPPRRRRDPSPPPSRTSSRRYFAFAPMACRWSVRVSAVGDKKKTE